MKVSQCGFKDPLITALLPQFFRQLSATIGLGINTYIRLLIDIPEKERKGLMKLLIIFDYFPSGTHPVGSNFGITREFTTMIGIGGNKHYIITITAIFS
ncbi:MAG: hypothetical protein KAR20_19275 [Candidatus Heimdallarchaeota archaeon]|nr:hypothetical protein [Candidatus Heimdallarchaeota archaeon]